MRVKEEKMRGSEWRGLGFEKKERKRRCLLVFGVSNAKYLAFDTPDGNALSIIKKQMPN